MKKLKLFIVINVIFVNLSGAVNAETALLASDDFVGASFWIISMGCLAATAFFFIERGSVPSNWRISITIAGVITGIALVHYWYVRQVWVITGDGSTLYRYIDWLITTPLLISQFYFILSSVRKTPSIIFWKLFIASLVMVFGGYMGEANFIPVILSFIIFLVGWIYILYEIFSGDAGKMAARSGNKPLVTAYNSMRMIVILGWAVYPLGYIFTYLTSNADDSILIIVFNSADFINKIVFGLIIWNAAIKQSGRAK